MLIINQTHFSKERIANKYILFTISISSINSN